METLLQDLRYGARLLAKQPGFTLVAVGVLALGVGANTAIFSVVNAVLLRPLPYPESERLVQVWESRPRQNMKRIEIAPHEFINWEEQSHSFEQMAAFDLVSYNMTGSDE